MNYKFIIKQHGNHYYFGLYPNNSNTQPIGISDDFDSYEKAARGICIFRQLIKESPEAFEQFSNERGYLFALKDNKYSISFKRTLPLTHKYEVPHCINRIYKHIDAPLEIYTEE